MSSPKRLWTGDWEQDSALRAEQLAERRRLLAERPHEAVASPPRPPAPDRRAIAALAADAAMTALRAIGTAMLAFAGLVRSGAVQLAALIRRANARVVAVAALALALIAAIAFALSALLSGSGTPGSGSASSAAVNEAEHWLGVQLVPLSRGGVAIETVNQTGAAAAAGLEPGDVLSQVDGHSIFSLGDAARTIDAMSPGDQAVIVINRGSEIYSTSFPMPARSGGP